MHDYTPIRYDKRALIFTSILFIFGIACFVVASMGLITFFPILVEVAGLAFIVFGIQIFTRYYLKLYTYRIETGDVNYFEDEFNRINKPINGKGLKLKIICTQGNKSSTVGGFPLACVLEVKKGTCKDLKRGKEARHGFNFCNNMWSRDKYTALVALNGDKVSVSFEPDNIILNELEKFANHIDEGEEQ